jgi:hypothetical protein
MMEIIMVGIVDYSQLIIDWLWSDIPNLESQLTVSRSEIGDVKKNKLELTNRINWFVHLW